MGDAYVCITVCLYMLSMSKIIVYWYVYRIKILLKALFDGNRILMLSASILLIVTQ